MKKESVLITLCVLVLIALLIVIYFTYFHSTYCNNAACFTDSVVKCKKATYVSNNPDTVIQYKIFGSSADKCEVNVKLLQIKKGDAELKVLENKEMNCLIPLGVLTYPERNLKDCHGILREEIQEIVIDRMHSQIVENLGKIKEDTTKVI